MTFVDALEQPKDIQRKQFSSKTCYFVGTPDYSVVAQILRLYFTSNIFQERLRGRRRTPGTPLSQSVSWYLKAVAESTCLMLT